MFKKLKVLTEEDVNKIIDEKLLNFKAETNKIKKKETEIPPFAKDAKMSVDILYEKAHKIDKYMDILLDSLDTLSDREFDLKIDNIKYRFIINIEYFDNRFVKVIDLNKERYSINKIIRVKGIDFLIKLIDRLEKRIVKKTQEIKNLNHEIDLKINLEEEA